MKNVNMILRIQEQNGQIREGQLIMKCSLVRTLGLIIRHHDSIIIKFSMVKV